MEYLLLCKGPPIGFVFYTMACLVGAVAFGFFAIYRLFSSDHYQNIDAKDWPKKLIYAMGNLLMAALSSTLMFCGLVLVGSLFLAIFMGK
jgi:hypothetical protein